MAIDFPFNPRIGDKHSEAGLTWVWDGAKWVAEAASGGGGGGGASVTVSNTPPLNPNVGDLWWNSDGEPGGGRLYVFWNDADSYQWVETNPSIGIPEDYANTLYLKRDASNDPVTGLCEFSQGIRFPDSTPLTGASVSETKLVNYESGTWTPVLTTPGGNLTGATLGTPLGCSYTRVGNVVHLFAEALPLSGTSSNWAVGDNVKFTGLPYAPSVNAVGKASLFETDRGVNFDVFVDSVSGDELNCVVTNAYNVSGTEIPRSDGLKNLVVTYLT